MAKKTVSTPETEAKNGVFLNNIKNALIRDAQKTNEDGTVAEFKSISIAVPTDISVNGWASLTVPSQLVYGATNYQTKQPLEGYSNALLGKPENERQLSVCTAEAVLYKNGKVKTPAVYEKQTFTNAEIAEMYISAKKAYKAEARAAAKAEAEG